MNSYTIAKVLDIVSEQQVGKTADYGHSIVDRPDGPPFVRSFPHGTLSILKKNPPKDQIVESLSENLDADDLKNILRKMNQDEYKSKKNFAILITSLMSRLGPNSNPIAASMFTAALSVLNMSDGNDNLLGVARKLAIRGASLSNVVSR